MFTRKHRLLSKKILLYIYALKMYVLKMYSPNYPPDEIRGRGPDKTSGGVT